MNATFRALNFTSGVGGGPPPSFPTNSVLDNFNRSDEGPPPSSSWGTKILTTDDQFEVVSNQCFTSTTGTAGNYWNTSFNADQEGFLTSVTNFDVGTELWLRVSGPNTSGVAGIVINVYGSAGGVRVFNYSSGTYTQLGLTMAQTFTNGDSVGATIIGSTVTVYYKVGAGAWTSLGSRITTISGSGYIGLRGVGNVTIDDFGGGNI